MGTYGVADPRGERQDLRGGRAAAVHDRERMTGRNPNRAVG